MLYDRARIQVQAGRGGDGSASFRREAHVPRGGPDGGDGGHGGDVVVECDDSLRDLQAFRRRTAYRADAGGDGGASLRHGANGETLVVRVPPGTHGARPRTAPLHDLVRAGPARGRRARRRGRPRQQALRDADPPAPRASPSAGCRARSAGSSSS